MLHGALKFIYFFLQVHHGGAGTTAAGLKAAVSNRLPGKITGFQLFNYYFLLGNFSLISLAYFPCLSCVHLVIWIQCPTTVVPFFGDQPFWGERVHTRGLGPAPIPIEEFSREKLINAIHFMEDPMVIVYYSDLLLILFRLLLALYG